MFSTKKKLKQRTGKNTVGRFQFLKLLVEEFYKSKSKGKFNEHSFSCLIPQLMLNENIGSKRVKRKYLSGLDTGPRDAQEQVMANLANFAYDPINYEYMRKLHIIDMFIDETNNNSNGKIVEFALGGLCNLCLDPLNKDYIVSKRGIVIVSRCLFSRNEEVLISAITTLIFLVTPATRIDITSPEIVECITTHLRHPSVRVRNLANVYLQTCCTKKQVDDAAHQVDMKLGRSEENMEVVPLCSAS